MRPALMGAILALGAATVVAPGAQAAQPSVPLHGRSDLSTGCRKDPELTPGKTTRQEIRSGGVTRDYLVHVPKDYRPGQAKPVVLSFHGHGKTDSYQEELTHFSDVDTIAVYPQGRTGTDGKSAWYGAPYSTADDVRFTQDLLDKLEDSLCVDTNRVFATGKSNGGGFTNVLACRLGDRIAAFAPVSGAYYPESGACRPREPVPMVSFHGTADHTIPYRGDNSKGVPPIADWLDDWADRDGCADEPTSSEVAPKVTREKWHDCSRRGALVHYRIDDLGHTWPSREPNKDSDKPTNIEATSVIWQFFTSHPLDRNDRNQPTVHSG